ncbi:MAG: FAD-dependent monooxygenase [Burkholderiales bacterium]|nr:FAD-dependent monooxygenase [Burkholderiales bacterium]
MSYQLPTFPYTTPPELRADAPAPARHPLVIVGGGLAGLTLAADLASRGVRCTLIDEDDTVGVRGASSRGIVYVQRSLEVMARIGIFERIAAKGATWSIGRVLAGDEALYSFDRQAGNVSRQPPFVNLQQFYLEWFLVDRIVELGLTDLRWKQRVVGVRSHAEHVELDVQAPDGRYTLQADWVVDAEGVNSFVRQALQLPEHTERGQDRWCITDVRFRQQRPQERWTWIEAPFNANRGVWQHPMADEVWRLDFQMAPDSDPAEVGKPEVARERVAQMLGPGVEFELVWVGPYSYRTMLMERFRHGRLLFIGDAAHAKSPFGARGGNSGIMDADNLGWRLGLLLQGRASPALLDRYDAERHRAAEENIRITARSGRFMQPRSPMEFTLRKAVLQLARRHAFARTLLDAGRMCTPHHYGGLPGFGPGAEAGRAVPNVPLGDDAGAPALLDVLRAAGSEPVAFVFGPVPAALARAVEAAGLPLRLQPTQSTLLRHATGATEGGVALIRPDSHLAATLPDNEPAALLAAARAALAMEPA